MKVLSIGNSFSEDAQAYLHQAAALSGKNITCYNMMIGGCSLARHYRNMLSGQKAYTLQINGENSGIFINLEDILQAGWSAITFQQVSSSSMHYDTYQPYLNELVAFARKMAPKTPIYLHETWAYEQGTARIASFGYEDQSEMYRDVHESYAQAAKEIGADGIIPSGTAFQYLYRHGAKIHRDGAHADLGVGRMTLAATWITALTGTDTRGMDWSTLKTAVPVTAEDIALAQEAGWVACH